MVVLMVIYHGRDITLNKSKSNRGHYVERILKVLSLRSRMIGNILWKFSMWWLEQGDGGQYMTQNPNLIGYCKGNPSKMTSNIWYQVQSPAKMGGI